MEEKDQVHVIVEYALTSSNHTGPHVLIQSLASVSACLKI